VNNGCFCERVIGYLHNRANIEQTSSKRRADIEQTSSKHRAGSSRSVGAQPPDSNVGLDLGF